MHSFARNITVLYIGGMSASQRCDAPAAAGQPVRDRSAGSDRGTGRGGLRAGLLADIGLPLVAYYLLHAFGASDRTALTVAAVAAGVRLVWEAWRRRRITWFASIMLAIFGVGAILTVTGGDPRTILLKDSIGTGLIGAVFLLSLASKVPLTLAAAQSARPRQAERIAQLYRDNPGGRRVFRVTALGWGIGMLGESLLRVPLVYLLPIDVMVGLSTVLMIVAMAALVVWNAVYLTRAAKRVPALAILLPRGPSRGID